MLLSSPKPGQQLSLVALVKARTCTHSTAHKLQGSTLSHLHTKYSATLLLNNSHFLTIPTERSLSIMIMKSTYTQGSLTNSNITGMPDNNIPKLWLYIPEPACNRGFCCFGSIYNSTSLPRPDRANTIVSAACVRTMLLSMLCILLCNY